MIMRTLIRRPVVSLHPPPSRCFSLLPHLPDLAVTWVQVVALSPLSQKVQLLDNAWGKMIPEPISYNDHPFKVDLCTMIVSTFSCLPEDIDAMGKWKRSGPRGMGFSLD